MTPTTTWRRLDLGVVLGLGVLALLVLLSIVTTVPLIAIFGTGTVAAALLTTARRTAYVALVSMGCALLAYTWVSELGVLDWVVRVVLCGLLSLLGLQAALLRERREDRLERMTVIAETAQRAVLRSIPTMIGSVGLAARYVSATAEALVGGDLYEVAATPFGVRVIVGDVRGKGLEAVQTAAAVLGAFRATAFTEGDLGALARSIDATLTHLVGDEEFVTAIIGEFHGDRVSLVNCGHHAPLLVERGEVSEVDTGEPTLPLGLGWSEPGVTEHRWPVGARMLFYTDGLIESRNRQGEFFPLADHSAELTDGSVEDALDVLVDRLLRFSGHRMDDDLALVLAESETV